jgi:AcrR family transcriptional regulator
MKEKAEYRSAIRSRENIRKAYVELMREKNTTSISVKEVVDRADINRSTFYAHYQDIYAVLEEIENEVVQKLLAFLDVNDHTELLYNPLPVFMQIGAELQQNKSFYCLVLQTKGSVFFTQKLKEIFLWHLVSDKKAFSKIARQQEFLVSMNVLSGGAVGVYSDWLVGKVNMPMPELANVLSNMATNVLKQYV